MIRTRFVTVAGAAETGGAYAEIEALLPPGAPPSRECAMPANEVRIEVLEGRLELRIDGAPRCLRAGEALTVPPGARHRIAVADTGVPARFLWRIRPAADDEGLLARAFGVTPAPAS